MRKFLLIWILSWVGALSLRADVREICSFREVAPLVDQNTLLVVDVDNTLIEPVGPIGSDQWFYGLYDHFGKSHGQDPSLDQAIVGVWNFVQRDLKVQPVESFTPMFLRQKQEKGIPVLGLTARNSAVLDVTLKQLESAGYDLSLSPVSKQPFQLEKKEYQNFDTAVYRGGVISVGEGNVKGRILSQVIERFGLSNKKIVFVDDHKKHVDAMEPILNKMKVSYFGRRYAALDEKVHQFKSRSVAKDLPTRKFCQKTGKQAAKL